MRVMRRLFGAGADRARVSRGAAAADPIIDRLVAATDKRLAYIKDYRSALRAPVLAARVCLGEAIARIPGPVEVGPRAWGEDTTVRALFARAEDSALCFSNDVGTRAFFALHPGTHCLALLAFQQVERRVLASALHGDALQAEVARTTVSFTEAQILAPAVDELALRDELLMRAFESLALRALERVGTMRGERRELERERSLLQARLQLARRNGTGFGSIANGEDASRVALEADLRRIVAELEQSAGRNLLPELLEQLLAVLAQPRESLDIEPTGVALDAMNFSVPATTPGALVPRVATLKLPGRGPFAVLLARFPRAELRTESRFAEAAKYL